MINKRVYFLQSKIFCYSFFSRFSGSRSWVQQISATNKELCPTIQSDIFEAVEKNEGQFKVRMFDLQAKPIQLAIVESKHCNNGELLAVFLTK